MSTNRLSSFSDGVFAIVVTLLILDIRIPSVAPARLGEALIRLLPEALTYVLSFFIVVLYWVVHHRVSHLVRSVNGPLIWLNMIWLLFVSVIPFPTALLGRYPLQQIPVIVYGVDLILANVTGFFITVYLKTHPELCVAPLGPGYVRRHVPSYLFTNGAYLLAIVLAGAVPAASYLIYAAVLLWLIVRYSRTREKGRAPA